MVDINRHFQSEHAEHYRLAAEDWARKQAKADRDEKIAKRVFSRVFLASEGAVATREHMARISNEVISAEEAALQSAEAANLAKAYRDAVEIEFESWRSRNATARTEMRM